MYRCEKCAAPSSHSDVPGRCKVCGSRLSAAPLKLRQASRLWIVFLVLGVVLVYALAIAIGVTMWG